MKIIRTLRNLKKPLRGTVVTIGVFDGVHVGHRAILKKVVRAAKRLRLKSVALTFDPHPLKVLRPKANVPSLISMNHRIRLIGEAGIDYLVILNFTRALSRLSPEKFVKNILVDKAGAKRVYVGENFYFGRGASVGPTALAGLARRFGVKVNIVKHVRVLGRVASSSLIRKLIMAGSLDEASRFLARPVSILGSVAGGAKLARALGYPTANINPHHEAIPPTGVYAVKAHLEDRLFNGILNIGTRPTFYSSRDKEPTIELHIFNFNRRIYGRDLEILFIKKLRDEIKFRNSAELVSQIRRDEIRALQILRSVLI